MTVSKERLTQILTNEKEFSQQDWLDFFESLTPEEQQAYISADGSQPRGDYEEPPQAIWAGSVKLWRKAHKIVCGWEVGEEFSEKTPYSDVYRRQLGEDSIIHRIAVFDKDAILIDVSTTLGPLVESPYASHRLAWCEVSEPDNDLIIDISKINNSARWDDVYQSIADLYSKFKD